MIQINLLQEDRRKTVVREKRDPTKLLVYMGFAVVLAGVVLFDVNLYAKVSETREKKQKIQATRTSVAHLANLARADEVERKLEVLNKKQSIIDDLIRNRIHWSKKLAALRDSLPDDIWIEQISLENPSNPRITYQTLTIKAATLNFARGVYRTGETLQALQASKEFMAGFEGNLSDVESRSEAWEKDAQEGVGERRIWRFSIEAKRPLPPSEITEKKK